MGDSINFDIGITCSRYESLRWFLGQWDAMLSWMNFQTHMLCKFFVNISIRTCSIDDSRDFNIINFHLYCRFLQTLRYWCTYLVICCGYSRSLLQSLPAHFCPMTNTIATGTSSILSWTSAFLSVRTLVWPRSSASKAMFSVFVRNFPCNCS